MVPLKENQKAFLIPVCCDGLWVAWMAPVKESQKAVSKVLSVLVSALSREGWKESARVTLMGQQILMVSVMDSTNVMVCSRERWSARQTP